MDPLRPWIRDFVLKAMPPEEKTQELYKGIRRILRFNFKNRQLIPEQEQALWLNDFLAPYVRTSVTRYVSKDAQNLTAALVSLNPMLEEGIGIYWRKLAEDMVKEEPYNSLPISSQALLGLVRVLDQVPWLEERTDYNHLLRLCTSTHPDKTEEVLVERLSIQARKITHKIYSDVGGDIL